MLKDEKGDRENARMGHEDELNLIANGNLKISEDLKTLLFTFTEIETKDDDEN